MPPSWWTQDFPEMVARREAMPGVERHQTTYVRYKCMPEAQVSQSGWNITACRRSAEQLMREQQLFVPDDHLLFSPFAPESINVKVVVAPAEYAVPVKQDRRLSPSFRVRVDVRHRHALALPLTVRAYIVGQQDKDNILKFNPDNDDSQRAVTELKGTTCISHHFEANAPAPDAQGARSGAAGPSNTACTSTPASHGSVLQRSSQQQQQQMGHGSVGSSLALASSDNLDSFMQDLSPVAGMPGSGQVQGSLLDTNMLLGLLNEPHTDKQLLEHMLVQQQQQQQHQQLSAMNGMGMFGMGGPGGGGNPLDTLAMEALMMGGGANPRAQALQAQARAQQQQQQQVQQSQRGGFGMPDGLPAPSASLVEPHVTSQELEFANLELLKPTRMNKVYMVFACTILDLDTLFVVYNVPTVGICRAEQRDKACQKLNISLTALSAALDGVAACSERLTYSYVGAEGGRKRDGADESDAGPKAAPANRSNTLLDIHHQPNGADGSNKTGAGSALYGSMQALAGTLPAASSGYGCAVSGMGVGMMGAGGGGMGMGMGGMDGQGAHGAVVPHAHARSRFALREWISEEYEITGLTRKLSKLDLQALLSSAGFPSDISHVADQAIISGPQWDEFAAAFCAVLSLLRQIASVWNQEDPCIVSGFDMDRAGTVQALAHEPAGTFICRFSMSQPGCLVLTNKTGTSHPNADSDGLVHAILKIDDLYERRVDTWIRDYAGATHVLDVYRQKRVDKRKVFTSNYTRLRELPTGETNAQALLMASMNSDTMGRLLDSR